jgi:hypothetical protein
MFVLASSVCMATVPETRCCISSASCRCLQVVLLKSVTTLLASSVALGIDKLWRGCKALVEHGSSRELRSGYHLIPGSGSLSIGQSRPTVTQSKLSSKDESIGALVPRLGCH